MRRYRLLLAGSLLLCLAAVGAVVLLGSLLDKDGRFGTGHYGLAANLHFIALLASPFVVHAALCVWWRHNYGLSAAGLLSVAISLGVTLWGNLADYLFWSRTPHPQDQVMYMGGFLAMLGSWGVCLAYFFIGVVVRSRRR